MIIDVAKFIGEGEPFWKELEDTLDQIDRGGEANFLTPATVNRLRYLYGRVSDDLVRVTTLSGEREVRAYLENLTARAYSRVHSRRRSLGGLKLGRWLRFGFPRAFRRNLLRAVDMLPLFYMLGGLASLLSRHYQRLGDLAAGTLVARENAVSEPDLAGIMPDKYNSFRDYPNLAARARNSISPAVAAIIQNALLRRQKLSDESRIAVYGEIAAHCRALVEFPQEATDGLSDENYLRNLA